MEITVFCQPTPRLACVQTPPVPFFFFGEGASVHRLDLEVNDNLATNEIANENSTRHQRITLKELTQFHTQDYLTTIFTFSSSLFEFEVDPNTNVERIMLLIMQTLIIPNNRIEQNRIETLLKCQKPSSQGTNPLLIWGHQLGENIQTKNYIQQQVKYLQLTN